MSNKFHCSRKAALCSRPALPNPVVVVLKFNIALSCYVDVDGHGQPLPRLPPLPFLYMPSTPTRIRNTRERDAPTKDSNNQPDAGAQGHRTRHDTEWHGMANNAFSLSLEGNETILPRPGSVVLATHLPRDWLCTVVR